MFSHVRWRLLGWNTLILVLLLASIGGAVYVTLARSLSAQVDRDLMGRSEEAARQLHGMSERGGRIGFDREGYRGGLFVLLIGADGAVLANPQGVDPATFAASVAPGPAPRSTTVALPNGPTRLYQRPLIDPRLPAGTLVVGESLLPQQQALHRLMIILLAGGGVGLLLAVGGAWFLAGRALVPIQHAFARQQEFVADAAHELRTPLTVLHSATDLLDRHRDVPLAVNAELLDDVRGEIRRMERLTDELLTLARSDLQTLDLAMGQVDLVALTAAVVRHLRSVAQEREIALSAQSADAPVTLEADPDRLHQVLIILLDNALAHTQPGGQVTTAVARDGRDAVVTIHDTGEGIAAEHLSRVFDRFYRADGARNRMDGGTGLGLAIAQALARAHGGDVTLTSAPHTGTVATVRLPIAERTRPHKRAVRRPARAFTRPDVPPAT